jgi:hypothetical protein
MVLGKAVENVLRLVEKKTGLPVHVEADTSLQPHILAKVTRARGKMPFHKVA